MEKLRLMDVGSYPLLSLQMASWVYWRLLAMKGNILNWNSHKWGLENLSTKIDEETTNASILIVNMWPFVGLFPYDLANMSIHANKLNHELNHLDDWMFLVYPTAELDHWTCRSFCKNSNSCEIQRDFNTLFALALDLLFIVPSPIVSPCSIFFCWFHQTFDQFWTGDFGWQRNTVDTEDGCSNPHDEDLQVVASWKINRRSLVTMVVTKKS